MKNLPFWHLTNKYPSFQDVDSKTAVEMVARVYGSMQELITEFNNLSTELQKSINDFESGLIESNDEFKTCITKTIHNFMKCIEDKILLQELTVETVVERLIKSGKIKAVGNYDETTESLDIVLSYEGGEK